ncbi:ArnT family glycosyltransferase [Rhodoluna lacicola]|uniref:ArnT family glycosyltransferase n=1 Tax=Rhodoluna lacicola TaxID=529884 RepID=UPI00222F4051|nr:glycosyltransferase family 39 protein [Rhodoluna lacicola]
MKKFDQAYFWLVVPFVAALISIGRVWPVLPAVMQDEYVYSMQARFTPFAEQLYPNYLFSWLYSGTSACGADFYSCGKGLNVLFFFATLAFIFLIARRLLSVTWGAIIATVAAFSPIHVYVSYFMPEAMYFAFITGTIYVALIAGAKHKLAWWVATGALLGLSALVKPHALFTLPAFLLFALLVAMRSESGSLGKGLIASLGKLGAFAAVKFGGGFAFAGVAGLSLFGSSYESSLNQFVSENARGQADVVAQTVSSVSPSEAVQAAEASGPGFFDVFIPHSLAHLALLLTVAGIPLLLSMSVIKDAVIKKQEVSASSQFLLLIGLLSLSFALVVGAFEGVVTSLGDDHSSRIITRYYEFLVPLLLIAAAVFAKFVEPKIRVRLIQSGFIIAALIFGWVYLSGVNQSFADSILLSGYLSGPAVIPIIDSIGIIVALVWIFSANSGSKLIVYVATPLILLIAGFTSQSYLLSQVGTNEAYFDVAGQKAKSILADVAGEKISIVGPVRYQNFTTKFWIDKPAIQDVTLPDGQAIDSESMPNVDYVVLIGNAKITGTTEVLDQAEGYAIVKIVR